VTGMLLIIQFFCYSEIALPEHPDQLFINEWVWLESRNVLRMDEYSPMCSGGQKPNRTLIYKLKLTSCCMLVKPAGNQRQC